MKKYFTKYLYVEGEVKPKDKFIYGIDGRYLAIASDDWNDQSKIFFPEHFKVKLFLCSRDIQVGDKIRGEYPSTLGFDVEVISEDNIGVPHWQIKGRDGNKHEYAKEDSLKVIGPISHEATWVTEGMVFDEEDIKRDILTKWYAGEDDYTEFQHRFPKGNETFTLPTDEEFINEYPIKIKGPCGHFH